MKKFLIVLVVVILSLSLMANEKVDISKGDDRLEIGPVTAIAIIELCIEVIVHSEEIVDGVEKMVEDIKELVYYVKACAETPAKAVSLAKIKARKKLEQLRLIYQKNIYRSYVGQPTIYVNLTDSVKEKFEF
ncbi:hypothetical protein SU69_00775 [Thermosipho melanesiensis]|uniref:Uncharacterized protein n=2 Tax=Thermosipho melanesiensis TaxID=46541 RepID=A6LJB9_THEM4|nr:hypothetical protein [Thermosipho melanesiensis]ABR30020.1 hypothetical protein Tmel_0143 [Thermosipho melanesiensis BI429]APT74797.1 hypothetical protein BW47_00800 [Thermosipho melanesiensis]OOC38615.1 hypothetical protein SU68_00775 [Thermosipho melanesiensis]OOC40419.1 hypothetical protein SU70_00775 [Thermosipho melanesiensis]OOC40684.1 hypothetical protein SU69_00775 [Thermosipho melanesiensis]